MAMEETPDTVTPNPNPEKLGVEFRLDSFLLKRTDNYFASARLAKREKMERYRGTILHL